MAAPMCKQMSNRLLTIFGFKTINRLTYIKARHNEKSRKFSSTRGHNYNESYQVIINEFGNPNNVLEGVSVQLPSKIGPNQMLVKVLMSPINPSDINMIEGTYHIRPALPCVGGNEGVGEIIEVGPSVERFHPGDWVISSIAARSSDSLAAGLWRQFLIPEPSNVIKVPNDMPVIGAATLAVNPCTAYRMICDFAKLKPGDILIQNGANSAVGQCVIQLAKHWGIKTINIIRDRPQKDELVNFLHDLGGDIVLTENERKQGGLKEIIKTIPERPKLALNCVGGDSSAHLVASLGKDGVIVTYGGMSRRPVMIPTGPTIFNRIKAYGYWNTDWMKENLHSPIKINMFQELCEFIAKGILKPPEADLFHIKDFKTAVSESMEGFKGKKKILVMDNSML
ncbi:enoyl-[acyl-carrier-protein] reductase, mitochondrial-like [Patella vulgata]|uniref:enoyl-[acyl-carrier-protein] reductase, mitochondrial-like n=1 Tax=Patella vulgata TaxID=6465 RepID=UPI00217F2560|nr:enoyl-[acyl-carrier-protein] reductase, mitochondrial-like [Patella vulgata]